MIAWKVPPGLPYLARAGGVFGWQRAEIGEGADSFSNGHVGPYRAVRRVESCGRGRRMIMLCL